jgi:hypothetical protein
MPIQLIIAYVIFCLTPLGLALSIAVRRRRVERALRRMHQD